MEKAEITQVSMLTNTKILFVNFELKKNHSCCKRLQNNPSIQTLLLARELRVDLTGKTPESLCFCNSKSGSEMTIFRMRISFLDVYAMKITTETNWPYLSLFPSFRVFGS